MYDDALYNVGMLELCSWVSTCISTYVYVCVGEYMYKYVRVCVCG